ncbi:NAD(P)H-dependent oxidoreductase [Streptomyces sp. JJ36]|uniref:NAD(P)H-dependent oxidoreductase n=1 Tax=Streptomyces sp. JJ36 TaxID=2736645 RepID=UPI001F2EE67D|nr:NAD(P)H-dependent oxidoreductase [Streptomyces sp. JJ36]MCF6525946.1 NAD(P)H-dependent oxidoreductase [Streptomyces sp. JJ36]
MRIHWIFAHPERRSLNGTLLDAGLDALTGAGHEVRLSDLYGMEFRPVVDAADFRRESCERLFVGAEQERAYREGKLADDIRAEHEKLDWADTVVLHFPLWWLGPPAILKGWFDRVLVQGYGFGVRDEDGRARRYGDGRLAGKRALVVTTVGARPSSFGPRGVHGHIDEVLFPLLHGTLWYTGMAALPPYVVYGADRATESEVAARAAELRERLLTLPETEPLPYRHEAGGDYDADLVLRPDAAPGRTGVGAHVRRRG